MRALIAFSGLLWCALAHAQEAPDKADNGPVSRGAYLTAAGGCLACHTDSENEGAAFAGGHLLETPYGNFLTPNITPDPDTGIGNWNADEFVAAMREGRSPAGEHYYPAFPYPSYAGLDEADVRDIFAYLTSLQPVARKNQAHQLHWYIPGRWAMGMWKALFSPWEYPQPLPEQDTQLQRGAYLVRHLGHCGECHTPRNIFGAQNLARELGGSPKDSTGRGAPNISPDDATGIGNWSRDELTFFLELGMLPDGDFAGGSMAAVIDENTALLTEADRAAITHYLRSLAAHTGPQKGTD